MKKGRRGSSETRPKEYDRRQTGTRNKITAVTSFKRIYDILGYVLGNSSAVSLSLHRTKGRSDRLAFSIDTNSNKPS